MKPDNMIPSHHPSDALLIDYAAGSLEPGRLLILGVHLGACAACRDVVALAESVGGALLCELPAAEMAPDALARAMARIERPPAPSQAPNATTPQDWIRVPADVALAAKRHRRWAAPGVWVAPVSGRARGPRSYLLRVGAGMSVPRHTHAGVELICVLKGAYTDRGEIHGPGDFAENDDTVEHTPRVTADGECICLIAADNALIPRDWVGRLFQPLVGI
ncbi:MAG TPA: ChrR family anti-sigma-E factor [Caulobacteraceae bacterium]